MIKENLEQVRKNIKDACDRAGRAPKDVTLIAVSKTKPVSMLMEAYEAGARDFGENKVQELVDKFDKLPSDVRWHMIGHLQTNKVKYIIDKVSLIHSVDSLHLAEEISKQAVKRNITVDILIEVNVGQEESKFGADAEKTAELAREIAALPGIRVKGLMTVAPYVVDAEENRPIFDKLRKLCVDITPILSDNAIVATNPAKAGTGVALPEGMQLSMGMTGDYEVAVEEGATYVRVGTGIFGERNYNL